MEKYVGLIRVRVYRGINLAIRDSRSSDPYVVVTMGDKKLKTRVVRSNCNPEWKDELTLCASDLNIPILLEVYDEDHFTKDDQIGEANVDIKPYLECLKNKSLNNPSKDGIVVSTVQPSKHNCLARESCIVWKSGKLVQDMTLRLKNVECGEVDIQIEWIDLAGSMSSKVN
ncbi:hypothetical protein QQ045_001096 [Rhodiola kirilowii]